MPARSFASSAVVVLLVIMNWFFHKIYWGGWIRAHNRRRKSLLADGTGAQTRLVWGLVLLGFTSLYREGFEVVLFLQTYYLRLGGGVVLKGTLIGLVLSGFVAVLTFVLQQRLPYRQMLVTTGILLGGVLLVMVGEQAQEMQLAHWISTTPVPGLTSITPAWAGLWFAIFPTYETLLAQLLAPPSLPSEALDPVVRRARLRLRLFRLDVGVDLFFQDLQRQSTVL